ncbi:Ribose operon repressor [Anaerohalosphaera lusitana]|uniref:Ribose operon repressor n=1 Tax=Anaerohalosphaera lusitana TaxID=1936003 RepID=A0A1U9NLE3_9BACT|nr:substrate-binding domain-containing protein [Anaerohalosphaera lusitana]AQT68762.1 Ribose operon repressor [Anaerohalosphaera lusitana]
MVSNSSLDKIQLDKRPKKALPLYEQIRSQVNSRIEDKSLKPGDALPSIAHLSKQWDVTYRTIKSAYELLEQDGVVTFKAGKGVVADSDRMLDNQGKTLSVTFVSCHLDDPYYALASTGIRRFALEKGLELTTIDVGNSKRRFINAISSPGQDVDGMLILPFEVSGYESAVQKTIEAGRKVVFVDRDLPNVNASYVGVDHFSVAFQATSHLLAVHDRPVYYLAFVDKPSGAREWFKGWRSAMQSYNHFNSLDRYIIDLAIDESELAGTIDVGLEYSIFAARRLFQTQKEEKYSIFAGNDFIARGVYIAAEELGLEIGKDVFLVGSNDMPFAAKMEVPLSSVHPIPSVEHIGYQAAKVLYEQLTGTIGNSVRQLIPVELVARASSVGPASK